MRLGNEGGIFAGFMHALHHGSASDGGAAQDMWPYQLFSHASGLRHSVV